MCVHCARMISSFWSSIGWDIGIGFHIFMKSSGLITWRLSINYYYENLTTSGSIFVIYAFLFSYVKMSQSKYAFICVLFFSISLLNRSGTVEDLATYRQQPEYLWHIHTTAHTDVRTHTTTAIGTILMNQNFFFCQRRVKCDDRKEKQKDFTIDTLKVQSHAMCIARVHWTWTVKLRLTVLSSWLII